MSLNEEMNSHWFKIDAGLAKLAEVRQTLLADMSSDLADPTEEIKKLKDGLYTIAVCGGVKAGKSTLLNSLFFGDSVLPTYDTPITAKLTFIRYGEGEPRFEVEFYSKEEWKSLESNYSEKERQELSVRLEKCAEKGGHRNNWICSPRHENYKGGGKNLKDELLKFISDPLSGHGVYTPFVKSVTITIDNPAIKNLQIVDTPGLNDSNEINSEETTGWIRQAHAVIYVLETRGASEPDIEFFQTYFPAAAAEARLFVQNKIDTEPDDYKGAKQAIRQYGKDPMYQEMGLFGEGEVICSYSSLTVLIQKKIAANISLTADEEFQWDNNIPTDFNGDPDCLEKKLAERLFQREGIVRLDKAKGLILDVYQTAKEQCEASIAACERQLPDCDKTEAQLNQDIDKFEEYKAKIDSLAEDAKEDFEVFIEECKHDIDESLDAASESITTKIRKAAEECGATDEAARARIPGELMRLKRIEFRKIRDVASGKRHGLRAKLIELRDDLQVAAVGSKVMEKVVIKTIDLDVRAKIDEVIEALDVSGDALYDAVPGRIMKVLTFQSKDDLVEKLMGIITKTVENSIKDCQDTLEDLFDQTGERELDNLLKKYREYCDDRERELTDAKSKLSESKNRKKELQDRLSQLNEHLLKLRESERDMKHLIDSAV